MVNLPHPFIYLITLVGGAKVKKKLKGSAMMESLASAVIMAVVLVILAGFLVQMSSRVKTATSIITLTNHNTNVMERIRQMAYDNSGELLDHYGTDVLGSTTIESEADVTTFHWDSFKVYHVKLTSKTKAKGAKTKLQNDFYMTDIGEPNVE